METNEELNRWAHRFTGRCLAGMDCECTPDDYCSSLDLAAIVESKAIEMVGYRKYGAELYSLLTRGFRDNPDVIEEARLLVTAPALTRVQAAMRAVEGK